MTYMVRDFTADTDVKTEKIRKMMETTNIQNRKEVESTKQMQTHSQKVKKSIKMY